VATLLQLMLNTKFTFERKVIFWFIWANYFKKINMD